MSETNTVSSQSLYVPFDKYGYKSVIDMCTNYAKEYRNVASGHPEVSRKLANMFQTIIDFAVGCEDLPDHIRYPPLQDWNMYGSDVSDPLVLYSRSTMQYVMSLMNEIMRQGAEKELTHEDLKEENLRINIGLKGDIK